MRDILAMLVLRNRVTGRFTVDDSPWSGRDLSGHCCNQ